MCSDVSRWYGSLLIVSTAFLGSGLLSAETRSAAESVIRVQVAEAVTSVLEDQRTTTGIVLAYRKATVASEVAGRVVERLVEPGHIADSGDVLIRTNDRRSTIRLDQARARAKARQAEADRAKQELERSERLLAQKTISQDTLDDHHFASERASAQVEAALADVAEARRELDETRVRAPFGGKVEAVHVQLGDWANPGQPIATLTDLSRARFVCGVSTRDVRLISVGEIVKITFADLGGIVTQGRVTSVGSVKSDPGGTFPVELALDDVEAIPLREGLVGIADWSSAVARSPVLAIPSSAVVRRRGRLVAYVIVNGYAIEKEIQTGRGTGELIEIHSGIREGEKVVIDGQFALRDGAAVQTVEVGLP